ncbi:MAG: glycosyltransferase [Rhodospirillales bacterium]|nr:glycosyltransferase [Rhodospirillales bacterium]
MDSVTMLWSGLAAAGAALWLCVLALPWQPWRGRERLEPVPAEDAADISLEDVTVLIPARDEATVIGDTLAALGSQGRGLRAVLVDDRSGDDTAEVALQAAPEGIVLDVQAGAPLSEGWTGKLWALEQGRRRIETPLTLLLDADITLRPGMLRALLAKRAETGAALVSIMAALRMRGGWEKLLLPAFIFFFRLLYPFHLSNGPGRQVAASAGGCVLVETAVLVQIGGFEAIRGALIDDCALARAVKDAGHRTWIGVSRGAESHRDYPTLGAVWRMVARTAYTQLLYSPVLLLLCTLLMALMFWAPIAGLGGPLAAQVASGVGLVGMTLCYLPTVRYYRLFSAWALTMPLIGTLYLAMTWHSALRHWGGRRSEWKGRVYGREPGGDRAA